MFKIQPLKGEIWPKSQSEFLITFEPNFARTTKVSAFCEVQGLSKRRQLDIQGSGLAPRIVATDKITFAEVAVESVNKCEIEFKNENKIPADLSFDKLSDTKYSSNWKVEPASFTLKPSETRKCTVTFTPTTIGDFSFNANWALKVGFNY
jgi:hypothetical protein